MWQFGHDLAKFDQNLKKNVCFKVDALTHNCSYDSFFYGIVHLPSLCNPTNKIDPKHLKKTKNIQKNG